VILGLSTACALGVGAQAPVTPQASTSQRLPSIGPIRFHVEVIVRTPDGPQRTLSYVRDTKYEAQVFAAAIAKDGTWEDDESEDGVGTYWPASTVLAIKVSKVVY
jgi:hypothetical protein